MRTTTFGVALHGRRVAHLTGDGQWWLEFDPEYIERHPRPVLGQWFEDRDLRKARQSLGLLSYFRNLLPERSALRSVVARSQGIGTDDEVGLLACLGVDLPGACAIEAAEERSRPDGQVVEESNALRFSLAGIQPKMSVRISDDYRTVLPLSGSDGQWILKLANAAFPGLTELEFGVMTWAREVGFEVPDIRLIDVAEVTDIPAALRTGHGPGYLIRRFDRVEGGRLHQEDFAQVLGVQPENKYDCDVVRLSQVMLRVLGREGHLVFLERLVFDILCGNGDAHLKNWSILYRDAEGRSASLAPCYDVVSTVVYPGLEASPGLKFPGSPPFRSLNAASFGKLLRVTRSDTDEILSRLKEVAVRAADTWSTKGAELVGGDVHRLITEHMEGVPLCRHWLGLSERKG
jgi:serine/threonine-protein kinase HipA